MTRTPFTTWLLAAALTAGASSASFAQTATPAPAPVPAATAPAPAAPPPQYGAPIDLATAKKAMAAAEAEATKNNWPVAISIVDSTGHLVMFQRLPNTQYGSIDIAMGKATTALNLRRPTKALEDGIKAAAGPNGNSTGLRLLGLPGIYPLEGGVPIMADGKIIGAIGVSGVLSTEDAMVATAGANAAK
jgi:glc operon protein GlcG